MSRYIDFDQFRAEQKRDHLMLKLFGEVHELPPSLPALVMIEVARMQKNGTHTASPYLVVEMAEGIFGKDLLNQWLAKGLTVDDLSGLIKRVTETYMGIEGNAQAPEQNQ